MTETNPLIWNPFRKGYLENPYEQLRLLREQNPVHKGINGCWMFFKYDDVKNFLTNPVFQTVKFSEVIAAKSLLLDEPDNFNNLAKGTSKFLFTLDPPDNTQIRMLIAKVWNINNLTGFIQETTEESIERLLKKKEPDILEDFAVFIPCRIISKIIGLKFEDYRKLKDLSYHTIRLFEFFESLHAFQLYNRKMKEFYEYLDTVIQTKKQNPDDTLISRLLEVNQTFAQPFTQWEIVSIIILLIFTGIETSISLFGQSVFYLIQNKEQAGLLQNHKLNMTNAVEELIRYITPNQYIRRVASADVEINGVKIKAGEHVIGVVASANRDADMFEEPETLNLTRETNPHLSFGYGLHYCFGAKLAREELKVSIPALFRRFPHLGLHPQAVHKWDNMIFNRMLKSLPVVLNQ